MDEEFYTPAEIATKLKVTKQAVYKWMKAGALDYVFVGSERRITTSALLRFVEDSTRKGKIVSGSSADQEASSGNSQPMQLAA
jgi:excisionase family DNA binding protein